ncbi:GumC family protein [Chitinophaga ginsengisoli]|uniref:non-specific protein-tyrosine kinase n=1 Tax=Chitinophaga ginsengisoli TaxID=363837 RepID=A0A2P8GD88_9BACT|nr:polysaccharide biosynthesis tyrosine autokinase [Chitinophaga ginsengisoli]PSL31953.1 capsular exopolysaccharide synthesis family protein [Chitinophaga ginsengisoli]
MNRNKDLNNKNVIIDLGDLFKKLLFHWPLYLIVLLLAAGGAFAYLKYALPRYMSSAKLYLKDEKKNGEETDLLKSLSLFNSGKNIENEMEVLKSPILVEKVIRDNRFNVRYYVKGTFRNEEIYEQNPLTLNFLGDSTNMGNYIFDVREDNKLLQVKWVNEQHDDNRSTFNVHSGEPFMVNNKQFSISFDPTVPDAARNTYRIQIDSVEELAYKKIEDIGTALVNRDATVVMVTYEDRIASRTAHFLTALLDTYNEYTLDDKNQVALKTIRFLNVRIDSLKDELGLLEKQEEQFKVQRGITDIEGSSKLALDQVKEADLKLNDANMQLSVFDQVESYINDPGTDYPFAPVLGNVDQALTGMINRYEELLKEKKRLSLSLQPNSMILQNTDAQIVDAKNTIRNYISGYKRNAGVAQSQMQTKVNQIQAKIANIPAYEREYINIKRQQGVKENLYLHLLKKKEEAAISYASNVTDNKVLAPAFVPSKPESPKKTLVYVGFLAAALVLCTVYVYIKYFLNNKVLDKSEIEQAFGRPVMAEIYQDETQGKDMSLHNRSILLEQIFNLRTNLRFLLSEHNSSATIMITSSISGEGKTFMTAHLGNALTVNNKKVVLLELDLRKPKLSRSLGLDNQVGVTSYMVESKTIDEIIKKVPGTEGLHLISSGPIPPNPVELIESNRMKALLETLKQRFDYIIIDTAPIGIVSDSKSLAPYVDCTLFMVRYNFTLKSKMTAVAENVRESFFRKTGVIFNGIEQDSFYPYYYYDHYSYAENGNKTKVWSTFAKKMKQRIA